MTQQHTITVLVDNKPGVLARVSGLFARRGYNIESLAVSITEDPDISRMTIVVNGDENVVEQITKQLHKLIDVSKVQDYIDDGRLRERAARIHVPQRRSVRNVGSEVAFVERHRFVRDESGYALAVNRLHARIVVAD